MNTTQTDTPQPTVTTVVDSRFRPGQLLSTPGALDACEAHNCNPLQLLSRHLRGDWGNVPTEDAESNEEALKCGLRLMSSYEIAPKLTIWVITEADRSCTTLLLPSEY